MTKRTWKLKLAVIVAVGVLSSSCGMKTGEQSRGGIKLGSTGACESEKDICQFTVKKSPIVLTVEVPANVSVNRSYVAEAFLDGEWLQVAVINCASNGQCGVDNTGMIQATVVNGRLVISHTYPYATSVGSVISQFRIKANDGVWVQGILVN